MTPDEREQIKRIADVERLEQENARLRKALEKCVTALDYPASGISRSAATEARAALEPEKEHQG